VLEHTEKWKLKNEETPPNKGAFITLDDIEDSDDVEGGRNKNKPDRRRMEWTSQRIK
jgi:hypothetical protein